MANDDEAKIAERLAEATDLSERLASLRAKLIDPADISMTAKTPFKFACYREGLVWRGAELSRAAVLCFREQQAVAGNVLVRAVIEVTAAMGHLQRLLKRQVDEGLQADLDGQAMRLLLGARDNPDMPESVNVMTMIAAADKVAPGIKLRYERLSEIAHPNWSGTCGAYSLNDHEKLITHFLCEQRRDTLRTLMGLPTLVGSLQVLLHWQSEAADLIKPVAQLCEERIKRAEEQAAETAPRA
jgi:hypothetical protein